MTAFTSGREIISRLSVEYASALVRSASARAASLLMSDTARKCTAGCFAARRALRLPMRPEPITATPSSLRFIPAPLKEKPYHEGHQGHDVKLYHKGHKGHKGHKENLSKGCGCRLSMSNIFFASFVLKLLPSFVSFASFVVKLLSSFVSFASLAVKLL